MKKVLMLAGILASLGVTGLRADVEVRIINPAGGGDTGWIRCVGLFCSIPAQVVGNYNVAANTAIQNMGINPFLDMSYTANSLNANPGQLIFEAMADGYNLNSPEFQLVGNGNSTMGDTVNITEYGGNNNLLCAAGFLPAGCGPVSLGSTALITRNNLPENLSVTAFSAVGNTVNPYSLGIVLSLNGAHQGGASGDIQLNAVPEPASVMLLGGVLMFTVSRLRRKVRTNS